MLTLFVLLMQSGLTYAAVSATLDRNVVDMGDSVTLRIATTGDDTGAQPDLTPLQKDFKILGTSRSSQISIVNGQRTDKHEWLIELAPVAKGDLILPALTVGNSKTAELTLQVNDTQAGNRAQAGQPVFVRSEISPLQGDTYVQQQILYIARLYYRVPLIEGSFTAPKINNALVEQLGDDRQYTAVMEGQSYQVVERRYAIFAEHSGRLTLPPILFSGRTLTTAGPRSRFDSYDSTIEQMLSRSGFNGRFFANPGKQVSLESNALTLDIKSRPASYSGSQWLPTEKLALQDSWASAPPVMRAGEPITRTLTLEAKGLEASQLPDIQLPGSDGLQIYPEHPKLINRTDGDWVYGRSEQRFTYVASQPGKLSLPAVQVTWWDNVHHKQQSTVLPARDVMVAAGSGKSAAPAATPNGKTASANGALPNKANIGGKTTTDYRRYWPVGAGLLVLLVLLLFVARLLRRQRKPQSAMEPRVQDGVRARVAPAPAPATNDNEVAKSSRHWLRDACTRSDARAAATALLDWTAATWPSPPPRSLGALATRVAPGADVIRQLEAALYSANHQNWDGQALLKLVNDGLLQPGKPTPSSQNTEDAPPLYPDWRKHAG